MIAIIPWLVILGIAAGPVLAAVERTALRRLTGWTVVLGLITGAHGILETAPPLLRMIGICCVLLAGMKGLVYAEWVRSGGQRLPLARYLVFSLLWFGMDPGTFGSKRRPLSWKGDIAIGVALMVVGTLGAWCVWKAGWDAIILTFIPLSLGFHFGALRVLKGIHRAAGFPVRTLFANVLATTGFGDFWSKRWNLGYSQMMQRVIGKPLQHAYGPTAGTAAVFLVSGLLHEIAITLPVRSGYGGPTLYFALHGLLTLWEKHRRRPLGRIPALLAVILPLGLLFPPAFRTEVIARCLDVFGRL